MLAIYKKELKSYFTTMTGYIFLAVLYLSVAFNFMLYNIESNLSSFSYTLTSSFIVYLVIVPLLTMRTFGDDNDKLLFTSPVSNLEIVVAKFLAATTLFLIGILLIGVFPILINVYGVLPVAETRNIFLGYSLLVISFISIGIFISSVVLNQVVSSILTFITLLLVFSMDTALPNLPTGQTASILFLMFLSLGVATIIYSNTKSFLVSGLMLLLLCAIIFIIYANNLSLFDSLIFKILNWFSLMSRFNNFSIGIFDSSDLIYFVTFPIAFVFLTTFQLEKRRWK